MRDLLRSENWLTTGRMRVYPLIMLAAMFFGLALLLMTANGMLDKRGEPIGTYFSNVWNAGAMVMSRAWGNMRDAVPFSGRAVRV